MNKLVYLFTITVLLALASCRQEPIKVGDTLPQFRLGSVEQGVFTSQQLQSGYSLLVFFATWCPGCQAELQELQELYSQHGNQVRMVAIARGQTLEEVQAYWAEQGLTMPVFADPQRKVYAKFATEGIPRTYLVNPEGKVMLALRGYSAGNMQSLQSLLQTLNTNNKAGGSTLIDTATTGYQ